MSICEAMSDRMPAVAAGRDAWSAEEDAHLAACLGCGAEWRLVVAASRLGVDVTVHSERLTPALLARVRQAKRQDRRQTWARGAASIAGLAIAAALLLTLVPRWREPAPAVRPPSAAARSAAPLQLAELEDATPAELEVVLTSFDEPAIPASTLDGPNLEGMDFTQVERALQTWEES